MLPFRKSVATSLETVRSVGRRAIDTLQTVAREMGRSDTPAQDEVESLLRDVPRFELASSPKKSIWPLEVSGSRLWYVPGSEAACGKPLALELKQELHLYGNALSRWSNHFVSKIVLLMNSYADAYRVQLHRIAGTSKDHDRHASTRTRSGSLEELDCEREPAQCASIG